MGWIRELRCLECGATYAPDPRLTTCTRCAREGKLGILDVVYPYEHLRAEWDAAMERRTTGMWRYLPLLPVSGSALPDLFTGGTPLFESPRLGRTLGVGHLFTKDDGRNATGSLKDRASALAVVKAREAGADTVACASTGNAASSLAGFAAAVGLSARIFVPRSAPEAKLAQLQVFGAHVIAVDGSYDQAYDLCTEACKRTGWYNRNAAINSYLIEGKKTVGFEIAEQLDWQSPDWLAMAVGDGCSISGAGKAFDELSRLGVTDRVPRLLGVQSEAADPLAEYFETGVYTPRTAAATVAESIAVGAPRNRTRAVHAIRSSGGTILRVGDAEILEAMGLWARWAGVFAEPSAAAALAGVIRARQSGVIGPEESVVVVSTGTGLKDVASARKIPGDVRTISPTLEALEELLAEVGR